MLDLTLWDNVAFADTLVSFPVENARQISAVPS
jgi:hypothetical protein